MAKVPNVPNDLTTDSQVYDQRRSGPPSDWFSSFMPVGYRHNCESALKWDPRSDRPRALT